MPDPRFSQIQDSVLADTFATLGIDPNEEGAFRVHEPFLNMLREYWGAPPDQRQDLPMPSIENMFDPGMEASLMATMDQFGYEFGDNPDAMTWVHEQRVPLAAAYKDPKMKNRVANLFVQSASKGRLRRQQEAMGQAGGMPPGPTPAPTPPPEGTYEREIWEDEQRRKALQGG